MSEKTTSEIQKINWERTRALKLLSDAERIMTETGCSLGAGIIREAVMKLWETGCDTY